MNTTIFETASNTANHQSAIANPKNKDFKSVIGNILLPGNSVSQAVKPLFSKNCRQTLIAAFTALLSVIALAGCAASDKDIENATRAASVLLGGGSGQLTIDEISRGLKQALSKSSEIVVNQVGTQNGYAADPQIRVPLPRDLIRAKQFASRVGLESVFDDLELKLNRAAEQAAPKARSIFLGSIQQMTLEDANGILRGPDNAATQYFQSKTSTCLLYTSPSPRDATLSRMPSSA